MTTLAVLSPFANYGAGDFLTDDSTFTPPAYARVFVLPTLYLTATQSGPNAQNVTTTILPPVSGVIPSTPHLPLSSLIGVATLPEAQAGVRQDVALTPYLATALVNALLAGSGGGSGLMPNTIAALMSLMTAWLNSLPTAPSATPGWWNNSGQPVFS